MVACHRVQAGIHQRDPPGLCVLSVYLHLIIGEIEGDIRGVQKIVRKIFLHHILLIAEANDEIVKAKRRIIFHDVPEYGLLADLYHWLGL